MKVRYLGKTEFLVLTNNKVYDVQSVEKAGTELSTTQERIICIHLNILKQ